MPTIEITEGEAKRLNDAVPPYLQGPKKTTMQVRVVIAEYLEAAAKLKAATGCSFPPGYTEEALNRPAESES